MRRKIVQFIDTGEFGGAEQALLRLLSSLDRSRYEPVLFCHGDPGIARLRSGVEDLDIPVRIVPRMQGRPAGSVAAARTREFVDAMTGVPAFFRALRRERADIFHAHLNWPLACKWGIVTAAVASVPAITATLQLFPPLPNTGASLGQFRMVSGIVHRFIAVSAGMARQLETELAVPGERIRVIENCAPAPPPIHPSAAAALRDSILAPHHPDSSLILTVARLTPQKGLQYLLEAAARVPRAIFAIAGDGPDRGALLTLADSLGIADRVRFLGTREDIPALLAACDIFVLPSLWEGLPLALLEAMAAGKPVVASRIECIAEVLGERECGIPVPPRDSASLAGAIVELLEDASLARNLGAAARSRAARDFSPRRMTENTETVYEELLEDSRVRGRLAS